MLLYVCSLHLKMMPPSYSYPNQLRIWIFPYRAFSDETCLCYSWNDSYVLSPTPQLHQLKNKINQFMPNRLFYLNFLDRSISYIRDFWSVFIITMFLKELLNLMQEVYTLIRRRVLRHLIWVYTVCQCPIYGTLGLNGLIIKSLFTK